MLIEQCYFDRFYMDTTIVSPEMEKEYLKDSFLGGRVYCMKEPLSTLPKARIQMKMWALFGDLI